MKPITITVTARGYKDCAELVRIIQDAGLQVVVPAELPTVAPEPERGEGTMMLRCTCIHGGGGHMPSCDMYGRTFGTLAQPAPVISGPPALVPPPEPRAGATEAGEMCGGPCDGRGVWWSPISLSWIHCKPCGGTGKRPAAKPASIRDGTGPIGKLSPEEKLVNLFSAFADHVEGLSDAEVEADARAAGLDPATEAARIRDVLKRGMDRALKHQSPAATAGEPESWRDGVCMVCGTTDRMQHYYHPPDWELAQLWRNAVAQVIDLEAQLAAEKAAREAAEKERDEARNGWEAAAAANREAGDWSDPAVFNAQCEAIDKHRSEHEAMKAQLEAARALPAKWRVTAGEGTSSVADWAHRKCANELESTLTPAAPKPGSGEGEK